MPVYGYDGSSWLPPKALTVSDGSAFVDAKKVFAWNGSAWVLAWVPPVTTATLTLSKTGVATGETYSVSLNVPSGLPEGSVVTIRYNDTTYMLTPAEGATVATQAGVSHAGTGSIYWYADVSTKGGDTTFGPTAQTVVTPVPPVTDASVSLSKTGVGLGEAYNVTLTTPPGFPASTSVRFYQGEYESTIAATETATTCTLTGASHDEAATFPWYADVIAGAGTTTFGPVTQTAYSPEAPPTEIVVNGGHCHDITNGITAASGYGVPLRLTGTFHVYQDVLLVDNLSVIATGATFLVNNNAGAYDAGRFRNDPKGNPGGYGGAGNFTWDGGTFDGNGAGIFTMSHCPGFTIRNATFYRYCSTAHPGHAIETNSSGGADNVTGAYTVQIVGNSFLGTDMGQRANSNDEPVHFDWNWTGSGAAAPTWSPGQPISEDTQVMCHNVLVQGNTFHRLSEAPPWEFAKCAIGGHDPASGILPTYRHNHWFINSNSIHGATGSTATNPDKGAIHMFRVRQCVAQGNALYGGVQGRFITAENATDATSCSANSNVALNPTLTGLNSIVVKNT